MLKPFGNPSEIYSSHYFIPFERQTMNYHRLQLINNQEFRQHCQIVGLTGRALEDMMNLLDADHNNKKIAWELLERRFERRGLNPQRFVRFEREESV